MEVASRLIRGINPGAADAFYRWLPLIQVEAQPGGLGVATREHLLTRRGAIRQPGWTLDSPTRRQIEATLRRVL